MHVIVPRNGVVGGSRWLLLYPGLFGRGRPVLEIVVAKTLEVLCGGHNV